MDVYIVTYFHCPLPLVQLLTGPQPCWMEGATTQPSWRHLQVLRLRRTRGWGSASVSMPRLRSCRYSRGWVGWCMSTVSRHLLGVQDDRA